MMPAMTSWPLLVEDPDLRFEDEPPPELGEIVGAWTNNTTRGLAPTPISLRLMKASLGLMGGFVVGLVGFFVVAGIYEHRGGHVEAGWFLDALAAGAALGVLASLPWALARPTRATLFVGTNGCAQIARGRAHVLRFRDIESMRERISTMTAHHIRTTARELRVRAPGRRERLWFVSKTKDDAGTDPNYQFVDAASRAWQAHRAGATSPDRRR